MSGALYEILSLLMRYWFTLLLAVLAVGSFFLLLYEKGLYSRVARRLRKGQGEYGLRLIAGDIEGMEIGQTLEIASQQIIGRARLCDIRIKQQDVLGRHVQLSPSGEGIRVISLGECFINLVSLAGEDLLVPGDVLSIANANFRVERGEDLGNIDEKEQTKQFPLA